MLTDKQKAMIMEYAELDGEVTLKLDEVKMLFNEIAEKSKEARWLREERDMLESRLQHYRGYE